MAEFRSRWSDWQPTGEAASRAVKVALETDPNVEPRSRKCELLNPIKDAFRTTPSEPTPYQHLEADWRAAIARAREAFARQGVTPSTGTFQAATWLEMLLTEGWDGRWRWTEKDARDALAAFYASRWTARISDDARVLLSTPVNKRWVDVDG